MEEKGRYLSNGRASWHCKENPYSICPCGLFETPHGRPIVHVHAHGLRPESLALRPQHHQPVISLYSTDYVYARYSILSLSFPLLN